MSPHHADCGCLIITRTTPCRSDPTAVRAASTIPAGDSTVPVRLDQRYQLRENGRDDISNQNRQATGGTGGS